VSILSSASIQQDLAGVEAVLRALTVVVRTGDRRRGGHGSGIVWSDDGTIVTNAHVATAERAEVELADGRRIEARRVALDPRRDLALLRTDALPVTPPLLGEPATLRPGQVVVALGHPMGVANSLTFGIVHSVGRAGGAGNPAIIRADIRLAPGNSGGPLADATGRLLGVNSMIVGGLGVAVSIDEVRQFVVAQRPRPSLGATLRSVAVRRPGDPTTMEHALLVLETTAGGAAERGGLLPGDVLLGHAGRPFASPDDLLALLHDAGPGGTLRLDVGRGGRRTTREVTLGPARTRRAA
jgi:serine protease Do